MKLKKYFFAALIPMLLGACSESFLELPPINDRNTVTAFNAASDFNLVLIGSYSQIARFDNAQGLYYSMMMLAGDGYSDNSVADNISEGFTQFMQNRVEANNGNIQAAWTQAYGALNAVNLVLSRIDAAPGIAENLRREYKGEALFLRGFIHFSLVRLFGDVPMVTAPIASVAEGYTLGRTAAAAVYAQIERDLAEAETLLPATRPAVGQGRATSGAAAAILGKALMQQGKFAQAVPVLKRVIDSNRYRLMPTFAELFVPAAANLPESIFEIQYRALNPRGSIMGSLTRRERLLMPSPKIIAAFETNDARRAVTLRTISGRVNVGKYADDAITAIWQGEQNWYVSRYADVLLLYSEALNEVAYGNAEAFTVLNQVRTRAGLPALTATDLPTQAAFRNAIARERMLELAFEGHRWFDLVRTGRALEEVAMVQKGDPLESFELLFPIPEIEVQLSPVLTQNPGY